MIRPLQLGPLLLDSNILYAPLAGCSDYAFRRMSARYRPGLMFCEMVKMEPLIRADAGTYRMLEFTEAMRPIGAQLCGSKVELAAQCAQIIEELGFDSLDFNCGCPVDKVTKDGSGSGMLKHPERIGEILRAMTEAVSIPVTVKIRAGWDDDSINAPEIARIAEEAGAKAISIHGRTREQRYRGNANWDHIRAAKEAVSSIKVIGNGDIFDADAAKAIFEQTGCDGILISRGTLGRPWIAEDIRRSFAGLPPLAFTGASYKEILRAHLDFITAYQPERQAILDMRRVGCWYLRNGKGTRKLRESMSRARTLAEVEELIEKYDWEEAAYY